MWHVKRLGFLLLPFLAACGAEQCQLDIYNADEEQERALREVYRAHADQFGAVDAEIALQSTWGRNDPRGETNGAYIRIRASLSLPVLRFVAMHELCHITALVETGSSDADHSDENLWTACERLMYSVSGLEEDSK